MASKLWNPYANHYLGRFLPLFRFQSLYEGEAEDQQMDEILKTELLSNSVERTLGRDADDGTRSVSQMVDTAESSSKARLPRLLLCNDAVA